MFRSTWQRPLILAAASLALFTGTACAAQASGPHMQASTSSMAVADHPKPCAAFGKGGEGGEGGAGGKGGQPGQPGQPGQSGRPGCLRFDDLPDKPKSKLTVVDKVYIVMALVADDSDATRDKIAKKYDLSHDQLDTWKHDYLNGDWFALMGGDFPS